MKHIKNIIFSVYAQGAMVQGLLSKDNISWLAGLVLTCIMILYYFRLWQKSKKDQE